MGQDNGEALGHVGVRLNAQLGAEFWALLLHFIVESPLVSTEAGVELSPTKHLHSLSVPIRQP